MKYLALGDSISIDEYTGVAGGGAASQFAKLIGATRFQNLTYDGCVTQGVLDELVKVTIQPQVITVTAGGNDLLMSAFAGGPVRRAIHGQELDLAGIKDRMQAIINRLKSFGAPAIVNTIYDPTDGVDSRLIELGFPSELRSMFDSLNYYIRWVVKAEGLILCDLEVLFHRHGFWSTDSWMVNNIEPNLAGATAIARRWLELFRGE